jgi:hypothetical protein
MFITRAAARESSRVLDFARILYPKHRGTARVPLPVAV